MSEIIQTIADIFANRGADEYGLEAVTQLQHALQCAILAEKEGAEPYLVVAALLHDIGHIFDKNHLPETIDENLDDKHELRANGWLKEHFGAEVADPVRLHVPAKRYLCTVDEAYQSKLSPTSYKSYLDQGGPMSESEKKQFESEPHYQNALRLRKWDDQGKDPEMATPELTYYFPLLESCMKISESDL